MHDDRVEPYRLWTGGDLDYKHVQQCVVATGTKTEAHNRWETEQITALPHDVHLYTDSSVQHDQAGYAVVGYSPDGVAERIVSRQLQKGSSIYTLTAKVY
jgi:hypothetical protein